MVEKGSGDDMAVMNIAGNRVLVTTDMLLEGVHFDLATASFEQVGYKSMAVSLSDCAAMCSTPIGAVGAISLPKSYGMEEISQLHMGLRKAAHEFNCPIIGGDMTSWDKQLTITVTMFSVMENGREPVYRNGAVVGDKIMVTGKLGGSILGRHLDFRPRVNEALWLYDNCKLHSMMDISDGIGGDLRHICRESGVSAIIDLENVPVSDAALGLDDGTPPAVHALTDGEDFELMFTVSASDCEKLKELWPGYSSEPLTEIGKIVTKDTAEIYLRENGEIREFSKSGFEH